MRRGVEFTLNGVRYGLDEATVREGLRGGAPEDVREHWVDVDGVHWPPKQAFSLATGLDRAEFTSHTALRHLRRLGLGTSDWSSGRTTSGKASPAPEGSGRRASATFVTADAASPDLVLVGCSGRKLSTPAQASDLFTGAGFIKARSYAVRAGLPWFVLSGKFGLLHPTEVIAPYDVYLGDESMAYRTAWGERVVTKLAASHDLSGAVVEVHAGRTYTKPLVAPLAAAGATLVEPLAGLGLGKRLAWYGVHGSGPVAAGVVDTADVSRLLDPANAMSPLDFLAAGRSVADVPGLYTWWVDVAGAHALSAGLGHRVAPGLVYAGRAGGQRPNGRLSTNTIWGRVGGMHIRGNRNFSTFRLTLTAALWDSAEGVVDEHSLSRWMHDRLAVAVLPLPAAAVFASEEHLLELTDPPLNLRGVPATPLRRDLSRRRSAVSASR